jgi:subtilisin family serine protease
MPKSKPTPQANPAKHAGKSAKGATRSKNTQSDETDPIQRNLVKSVIALPLLKRIEEKPKDPISVIIDVNIRCSWGPAVAKQWVLNWIRESAAKWGDANVAQSISEQKSAKSKQYVYAKLQGKVIQKLVEEDGNKKPGEQCIYHVWPDFDIKPLIWRSVATIKADACQRAFMTSGKGIVWAVIDSGIGRHAHFTKHKNLEDLPPSIKHMDFTQDPPVEIAAKDLTDDFGHGTHVAGIIAGELDRSAPPYAIVTEKNSFGDVLYSKQEMDGVVGVAPQCKLVSYKVIGGPDGGPVSNVIAAVEHIQEINGYGREVVIHGVNLSLGYEFDAEWFACGQSPICVEVNRLVKQGVYVVIAAGNSGKGSALTINDPANAEEAITVGATHRDMPYTYGVSYFSSKGPTGDGRRKPDLLAPGERILSCGAGPDLKKYKDEVNATGDDAAYYIERSGTSMAAPHVSGLIAGILSVRTEFKGRPEELKKILLNSCTDLGREAGFQGRGLADMMRTIQAI